MGTVISWIIVFAILCGCIFLWTYRIHRGPNADSDENNDCNGDCLHCAKNIVNNKNYPSELKEKAVQEYQQGKGSLRDICKKFGIRKKKQLQDWIKVYNAHGDFNSRKGSGGGSYMKKARSTTQEDRLHIVKDCLENKMVHFNK